MDNTPASTRRSLDGLYRDLVAARDAIARWGDRGAGGQSLAQADPAIASALMLPTAPGSPILFDSFFYEMVNSDVRAAKADPWIHFQLHGVREQRDPHPAVSSQWLSRFIPARDDVGVIDQFLLDPRYWLIRPNEGIDVEGYVTSGRWSGHRHPLLEALAQGVLADWVADAQVISDDPESAGLRESFLFLGSRHPGLNPRLDDIVDEHHFAMAPPYRVFPGVAVANQRNQLALLGTDHRQSRDDVVALGTRGLSWISPLERTVRTAVVLPAGSCPSLDQLRSLPEDTLVIPGDELTERALRTAAAAASLSLEIWSSRHAVQIRSESLFFPSANVWSGAPAARVRRARKRGRRRVEVTADASPTEVTVTSSPHALGSESVQTSIEGLLLAIDGRPRIRLSKDLGHVRDLLADLVGLAP